MFELFFLLGMLRACGLALTFELLFVEPFTALNKVGHLAVGRVQTLLVFGQRLVEPRGGLCQFVVGPFKRGHVLQGQLVLLLAEGQLIEPQGICCHRSTHFSVGNFNFMKCPLLTGRHGR